MADSKFQAIRTEEPRRVEQEGFVDEPHHPPSDDDVIVVAAEDSSPAVLVTEPQYVDVVAPANMREGYQFVVDLNGTSTTVQVPAGGAQKGDTFQARVISGSTSDDDGGHNIPEGHFRDGMCDCFNHPGSCLLSFCCQPCALGQVMTRMGLDLSGKPMRNNLEHPRGHAYKVLFWILVGILVCLFLIAPLAQMVLRIFGLYMIYLTWQVYKHVQRKYHIPQDDGMGLVLACFCRPCITAQLLRHTADHHKFPYNICNERGLHETAPYMDDNSVNDNGNGTDEVEMQQDTAVPHAKVIDVV